MRFGSYVAKLIRRHNSDATSVAARAYGLQPPPHALLRSVFEIFYNVNIFYNAVVHTLFTNAPVHVAEKTNFPILLALN